MGGHGFEPNRAFRHYRYGFFGILRKYRLVCLRKISTKSIIPRVDNLLSQNKSNHRETLEKRYLNLFIYWNKPPTVMANLLLEINKILARTFRKKRQCILKLADKDIVAYINTVLKGS